MASGTPETNGETPEQNGQFEGYSDYHSVTNRVAKSVELAIQAYAEVEGLHQENKGPDRDQAAYARRDIQSAAIRLLPELRENCELTDDEDSIYHEVKYRWIDEGTENVGPFLEEFRQLRLVNELPEWVRQFVEDIQTIAWEVGYLRAGRYEEQRNGLDPVEEDVDDMFKGINIHA